MGNLGKKIRAVSAQLQRAATVEECDKILDKLIQIANELDAAGSERNAVLEEAAKVAENVRDGYSAVIRVDVSEQEFARDIDGPWVLNSDVAEAIRALKNNAAPQVPSTTLKIREQSELVGAASHQRWCALLQGDHTKECDCQPAAPAKEQG